MTRKDPFAGMQLSDQAAAGKLDQRLFARAKPRVELPAREPEAPPPIAPPVSVDRKSAREARRGEQARPKFDLNEQPLYKATYAFTQEELEALDDLKLELRRAHDRRVTKNDLVRAAVHQLLEDHRANRQRSYATRKITRSPEV